MMNNDFTDMLTHVYECLDCDKRVDGGSRVTIYCPVCGSADMRRQQEPLMGLVVDFMDNNVLTCGRVLEGERTGGRLWVDQGDSTILVDPNTIVDVAVDTAILTDMQMHELTHLAKVRAEARKRMQAETDLAERVMSMAKDLEARYRRGIIVAPDYLLAMQDRLMSILDEA